MVMTDLAAARRIVSAVPDPELPMVTLAELGIVREVVMDGSAIRVSLSPTYTGCPALHEMRADITQRLQRAGFDDVLVELVLSPAWTTDWISPEGRRKLHAAGIAPPGAVTRTVGRVPLSLTAPRTVTCPRCGGADTARTAAFGATACRSLHRCDACGEPFEHMKEI